MGACMADGVIEALIADHNLSERFRRRLSDDELGKQARRDYIALCAAEGRPVDPITLDDAYYKAIDDRYGRPHWTGD